MKRTILILIALVPYLMIAQSPVKKKKYPSLLWEITGNGLKKPSYLFGTMHVSSKMAFHLADSFYIGIRNADMVALETNPESWQEDMSKYEFAGRDFGGMPFNPWGGYNSAAGEYFSINTLRISKYDKRIERALYSNPSSINNLLYRSYGNESSDFEEDTYLDMYIYQCGKKWGKKVAGVEKYGESMKLMLEAYRDAAKDKTRKERSYDGDEGYSAVNLQEAYRTGNLDWLDSINRYNSFSSAFDEKFLYRRNEIQAGSIDSILRTGQSLFVGVGAAHLPGNRGVIEILRNKGFRVRPVKMGERDSQHKNQVEKLRVPVTFNTQTAADGMYKVDIPGKFYQFGDMGMPDQQQYADMANGSYYMVSRIVTSAGLWGHNTDKVYRIIDSLLYENIPGKIISKTVITRNGYKGFDLINRTRRGDVQRYNIFITPFEVIIFKMSGTADYVKDGEESKKFFGSIQLKEFNDPAAAAKKFTPHYGGFAASFPHEPYVTNNGNWIYDAEDKATKTQFRIIRTDVHNHHFAEEDTFDLGLMDESFASSEFIDKTVIRKQITWKGYPALDAQYKGRNGDVYMARYIIQGPHYYTLLTHGRQESVAMKNFLNSFELRPFTYRAFKEINDTSLYYSVKSAVFPSTEKEKLDLPGGYNFFAGEDEDESEDDLLQAGIFRNKVITNDTTGEKIFVSFFKLQRYSYLGDSSILDDVKGKSVADDTSWIIRSKKKYQLPNKTRVWEIMVSDTGSSRMIWEKKFYKDGISYELLTETDTLTPPSEFVRTFFDSFTPVDTLKSIDPFRKKTDLFFADFQSNDSTTHQRAVKGIYMITFDSSDLPMLKKIISSLNWKEKKYLDTKKSLIEKLDDIHSKETSDYLKQLYYVAGDTVELQYTVLEVLLQQQTSDAFSTFRDIITNEPPVLNMNSDQSTIPGWPSSVVTPPLSRQQYGGYDNGNFMDELYDSLQLTRTILPDLLPLLNLDDYKYSIMELLGRMVDSNLVKPKDYDSYFSKFFLEAKQELKKQAIAEKKKAIEKAEKDKEAKPNSYLTIYEDDNKDYGNESLSLYATLLMPFWDTKPNVQPVINQILGSQDKRLKYQTLMLMIRNNKPYQDSLLKYFAGLDEYRYELYEELDGLGKLQKFPAQFNTHQYLAKSKLLGQKLYGKPDSLVYISRLPATVKGKTGWVYFFKYKNKKDDATWKIATVGLVPQDASKFEWDATKRNVIVNEYSILYETTSSSTAYAYNFTGFSDTRIKEDQPVEAQLKKELKRMVYSRRNSARQFYSKEIDKGGVFDGEEEGVE
jgi:uncharacterized protein YbaP (TraB family)